MSKDVKFDIKAQNKTDQAFNAVDRRLKGITGGLSSMKTAMIGIGAAVGGFYAIGKGLEAVTTAAMGQREAESKLNAVLQSTGHAAGFTLEELKKMASGLQDVTTFGDETILTGMSILATFKNIQGEGFERTTKAALDMSTILGTDLKSSMIMLGKALNDPAQGLSALSRAGVTFSETQKENIKGLIEMGLVTEAQTLMLEELESQFGGAAEAAGGPFDKALKQLKNTFGDLLEEIGFAIVDNEAFTVILGEVKDYLTSLIPYVGILVQQFIAWIGPVDVLKIHLQSFLNTVRIMIKPLQVMYNLLKAVFNYVGKGFGTLAGGAVTSLEKFGSGDIFGGIGEIGHMVGTLGSQAGDFIKDVTGSFQSGTGPGGLPRDGLYYGHEGEIVQDQEESRRMRLAGAGAGGINITIAPTFMTGDRNAARSVAVEIKRALKEVGVSWGE